MPPAITNGNMSSGSNYASSGLYSSKHEGQPSGMKMSRPSDKGNRSSSVTGNGHIITNSTDITAPNGTNMTGPQVVTH